MSAYANDIGFINSQTNLCEAVASFNKLSSAKVNWNKSESLAVSGERYKELTLPGGLSWRTGGLNYLVIHLGDQAFMSKNWEAALEKVEGRLKRWKWVLQWMSLNGQVIVINNLVSSMLWHRLAFTDPPKPAVQDTGVHGGFSLGLSALDSIECPFFAEGERRTWLGPPGEQRSDVQAPVCPKAAVWSTGSGLETCG